LDAVLALILVTVGLSVLFTYGPLGKGHLVLGEGCITQVTSDATGRTVYSGTSKTPDISPPSLSLSPGTYTVSCIGIPSRHMFTVKAGQTTTAEWLDGCCGAP
jgi:hypothetical protein